MPSKKDKYDSYLLSIAADASRRGQGSSSGYRSGRGLPRRHRHDSGLPCSDLACVAMCLVCMTSIVFWMHVAAGFIAVPSVLRRGDSGDRGAASPSAVASGAAADSERFVAAIVRSRETAAAASLDSQGRGPDQGMVLPLPPLPLLGPSGAVDWVLPEANEWRLPEEGGGRGGGEEADFLADLSAPLARRIGGGGSGGGGTPTVEPTAAPVCRRPPPNATVAANGSLVLPGGVVLDSWADPEEVEGEELCVKSDHATTQPFICLCTRPRLKMTQQRGCAWWRRAEHLRQR